MSIDDGEGRRLWAPWRMAYVTAPPEDGCFLCRILAGRDDRANLLLKRGTLGAVVLNRFPYNNGHVMVFPHRHVGETSALGDAERLELMHLLDAAIAALRAAMEPDGFNVGINIGRTAGAGLAEHLHVHVVPRWNGDTNFMPVMADVKVVPQFLEETWDRLAPLLSAAPGR